jgi:hypothetical protein
VDVKNWAEIVEKFVWVASWLDGRSISRTR